MKEAGKEDSGSHNTAALTHSLTLEFILKDESLLQEDIPCLKREEEVVGMGLGNYCV